MSDLDKYLSPNFPLQLSREELDTNQFSPLYQLLQMQDDVMFRELRQCIVNLLDLVISLGT